MDEVQDDGGSAVDLGLDEAEIETSETADTGDGGDSEQELGAI